MGITNDLLRTHVDQGSLTTPVPCFYIYIYICTLLISHKYICVHSTHQSNIFQFCIYTQIHLSVASCGQGRSNLLSPDCVPEAPVHLPGGKFGDTKHATSKKKTCVPQLDLIKAFFLGGEGITFGGCPLRLP